MLLPTIILILLYSKQICANYTTIDIVRNNLQLEQHLEKAHLMDKILLDKPGPKPRDNDSIALYRYLDDQFYGKIVIGHPGQTLNVAFDTAWSLSWVLSSKCSSIRRVGCWFHNKYDHTKSSEYKKDGRPFTMNSGRFNWTGFYSYDNISIAHSNATNQSFIEMVQVPKSFIFDKADGVLGLGLKTDDYDPFFYTLTKQKKIKNPLFSIYLNRDRQSTRGGNIMLGFLDDKHIHQVIVNNKTVKDNITYVKVDPVSYWQFNLDKIYVNDIEGGVLCPDGCKAIVDTSSNAIVGPEDEIEKINAVIKARAFYFGRYTVECDTVNKLPKIDFSLGGRNFTLKGPDYIVKMSYRAITVCISAFSPADTAQEHGIWILGGAFLAQYYSVYNIQDNTIGFVKAA